MMSLAWQDNKIAIMSGLRLHNTLQLRVGDSGGGGLSAEVVNLHS